MHYAKRLILWAHDFLTAIKFIQSSSAVEHPPCFHRNQFELIFRSLHKHFALTEDAEITIEANPGTVSLEHLKKIRAIGINRISFGVQSANSEELRMLERAHDFFDVINSVSWARSVGFDNLNLDLIYGLPEQTLPTWQSTVKRILDLHPDHISAYALTLEHGTPFGRWSIRGVCFHYPILILRQICTNGQVMLLNQRVIFNMKFQIGQSQAVNVLIIFNIGADCLTWVWVRVRMDTPMAIVIQMC